MTNISPKRITLRAFKIENPSITRAHSDILGLLQQVLTAESIAADRRMTLNVDDPDRDLLANFTWAQNNTYLFGMMLRVIPADNGGIMDERLFKQPTITMAEVSEGDPNQSQYKDHFYFAINNNFLFTNLAGNINIDRLQTYINWLLESVRGERLFQFSELTKLPDGVVLSDIRDIQFVGGANVVSTGPTESEPKTIAANLVNITDSILEKLLGHDTANLEKIRNSQLVEAKLLLKIKGKSKGLAAEEYNRMMSAIVTNVTNDSGIIVHTKSGNKYTGAAVKVKKNTTIQCVGPNRIVEEQLKQQMELFLSEIRKQENG